MLVELVNLAQLHDARVFLAEAVGARGAERGRVIGGIEGGHPHDLGALLQGELDYMLVESHLHQDSRSAQLSATLAGLREIERWMPRLFRRPLRAYIRRTQKQLVKLTEEADLDVP